MTVTTTKSAYALGLQDGFPFLIAVIPFAVLFGVVATEAGLDLLQVLSFSVVVIAGAAQFTALQLMIEEAPTLVILVTALAVNLRMAMYSASLTPYLGDAPLLTRVFVSYFLVDQSYACSIARFEENPHWSTATRVSYFFGAITFVCPMWYAMTVVGALIGTTLPEWLALDFAVPITFLALIAPMLRTIPHLAAAVTSIVLALVFAFLPYNLGLLIAALTAMAVGAELERRA